jgi:hypothetical protein
MHGGDSALAQRLTEDLAEAIAQRTEALIANPTERLAGEIRGMQDAMLMIGVTYDKLTQRRPETKP